jgi:hypothetical protein
MPVFSPEKQARCGLPDTPEIPPLPEMEPCQVGEIPVLELQTEIFAIDGEPGEPGDSGQDGCDAVDGTEGQDATDGDPGTDGCDAVDGTDSQDPPDGDPGTDGCDAVDGTDSQDPVDGEPGEDGCDAVDGTEAQDATDGEPGQDGCDAVDGGDAQDATDGEPGEDGADGCDAVDGGDAQDATDGEPGEDGCDAVDGTEAQDATDGEPGQDGCDAVDGEDAQDGSDGEPGEPGEDGVQPYIVSPLTSISADDSDRPHRFKVKCLKRISGNTWLVVDCETDDGESEIQAFNPSGSDLSPSKTYLAAKDNAGNWIILSGAGEGGGGGAPVTRIEATVVLPISCTVGFYNCEPAPQERPINYETKLPTNTLLTNPIMSDFSAGFIAAKSMGLIKRDNIEYRPVPAYYSSSEPIPVFDWRVSEEEPATPPDWIGSWTVFFEYPFDLGRLYRFSGYRRPPVIGEKMYADPETLTVPLYRLRLEVEQNSGIACIEPCTPSFDNSGWVRLKYIDGGDEIVELPPPVPPPGWTFVEYDFGGNMILKKTFVKPREDEDDEPEIREETIALPSQPGNTGAGNFYFQSCNTLTGYCTYRYIPRTVTYEQCSEFPFWFGLTGPDRWSLTSNINDAQLNYDPCVCDYLDRNERLIPGQKLEYAAKKTVLTYDLPDTLDEANRRGELEFEYCSVTPPKEYTASFEGTPRMLVHQFSKGTKVMHGTYLSPTDYYLGDYQVFDEAPPDGFVYPYKGAFYIEFENSYTPIVDQPFGIFNDCENAALMGIFLREDENYIKYFMTARLDYVPFGYAIETRTPSCFYKVTAEENCAPRMVGVRYSVIRVDRELYIQGACYKPCTSLTQM